MGGQADCGGAEEEIRVIGKLERLRGKTDEGSIRQRKKAERKFAELLGEYDCGQG